MNKTPEKPEPKPGDIVYIVGKVKYFSGAVGNRPIVRVETNEADKVDSFLMYADQIRWFESPEEVI